MVPQPAMSCHARQSPRAHLCIVLAFSLALSAGCSATRESTKTVRNTVEQLLISQSMERGLDVAAKLPPPNGAVVVESAGLTDDNKCAREAVVEWLRQHGWHITGKEGAYLLHLSPYVCGTDQRRPVVRVAATQGTSV